MFRSIALLALIAVGVLIAAPIEFDAASIKPYRAAGEGGRLGAPGGAPLKFMPGRVTGKNVSVWRMILDAYHLTQYQLSGGPGWIQSDIFEFEAKAADSSANGEQLRLMLQVLLAERFKLVLRRETREMPVYALTLAKSGLGPALMKEGEDTERRPNQTRTGEFYAVGQGTMQVFAERVALLDLAPGAADLGRPLLDRTGLSGTYAWTLRWDAGDFRTVVKEDLGLKMDAEKAPMDAVVIEHVERPSEN
jgi:uncharacterized protein (TIGR03435 family)